MSRIETNYVNPNVRVNPLVEKKIEVLEQALQQSGPVDESLFKPHEIRLIDKRGIPWYISHLKELLAEQNEAPSEE